MQGLMVQGGDPTVRIQIAWKLLNFLLLLLSQLIWFGPFHISLCPLIKGTGKGGESIWVSHLTTSFILEVSKSKLYNAQLILVDK